MTCELESGTSVDRDSVLRRLVELQYERNDVDFHRGTFRVRGDIVEVFPAYEADTAIRIEWWGDQIEAISEIDPLRGKVKRKIDRTRDLPGLALRDARSEHDAARDRARSATSCASGSSVLSRAGQAARAPAARAAHDVRPRVDRADGLLLGHRELLAAPDRARTPASRRRR